jgi:hypothetical protein
MIRNTVAEPPYMWKIVIRMMIGDKNVTQHREDLKPALSDE